MKAERRHDLKSNTLASGLSHFPGFWKQHGGKVLLALIVFLGTALLVRNRLDTQRQQHDVSLEKLSSAREKLLRLNIESRDFAAPKEVENDVNERLAVVMNQATDPLLKAEALVIRGDLYFELSMQPPIPGATTQPSLQKPGTDEELAKKAGDAYEEVLSKYSEYRHSTTTAHFGLAALAENREQWDVASNHYNAIKDDPTIPAAYRTMAQMRQQELDRLRVPPLLGKPATKPTTQPDALAPAGPIGPAMTGATSQPASKPAN